MGAWRDKSICISKQQCSWDGWNVIESVINGYALVIAEQTICKCTPRSLVIIAMIQTENFVPLNNDSVQSNNFLTYVILSGISGIYILKLVLILMIYFQCDLIN